MKMQKKFTYKNLEFNVEINKKINFIFTLEANAQ